MTKGKSAALILLAATLAVGLGACGRRGPLEPHPDAPPEQRARQQVENEAERREGQQPGSRPGLAGSRRTLSSPIKTPDRPFILDSLL